MVRKKLIVSQPVEQTRFSDSRVADYYQLEQEVLVLDTFIL
jgi:hypothetical protein